MKQRILILVYGFIAWTLFFLVARALFLLYQFDLTAALSFKDILLIFVHGVRMDMSMAGYFSLLSGLLLTLTFFTRGKRIWLFWLTYNAIVLFVVSFIIVLDFELYVHWGFRLDATPLMYMGKEAASSGDFWKSILLILYWLVISGTALVLFIRFFKARILSLTPASWVASPVLLLITALLIIPIRGSLGVAPMNTGFVYFHPDNIYANHAAVNVVWNFGYAVQKMKRLKYSDNFFDNDRTETLFKEMFPAPDSTRLLLRKGKHNVLVIMLESYTSSFIEPLGGRPGIAPRFNALTKEGILFDNFYSSGDRTDKGIVSVLNGYPAQPVTSIIKDAKKTESLPYLNKIFKERGYATEFTYGYNINYANFNSYLIHANFDHVTHSMDFPQELNTSKWGVHDHYVFEKFFEETQKISQPFFKIMMTQSSHEPFDVPMETVIKGDDEISMFLNSAYYTDKSLGEFIDKAKQQPWWENTLVVITADHGHPLPDNPGVSNAGRFKIPMLWLGGALAVRDTVVHTLGEQTDIANTVLGQFGEYNDKFLFSHNMLATPDNPFVVFIYNNGFGLVKEGKIAIYDNVSNRYSIQQGSFTEEELEQGKAYMQKLYWDFNSR